MPRMEEVLHIARLEGKDGSTSLRRAMELEFPYLCELLLQRGVNAAAPTKSEVTIFWFPRSFCAYAAPFLI